jgi:hypothetical protein
MSHYLEIGTRVRVNTEYAREWELGNFEGLVGLIGTVVGNYGDRIEVIYPPKSKRGAEMLVTFMNPGSLEAVDLPPIPNVPLHLSFVHSTRNPKANRKHWLFEVTSKGYLTPPPMTMRMGIGPQRADLEERIRTALRWAIKFTTDNGKDMAFDPDTLVLNCVVGIFGHYTADGTGADWETPKPVPPEFKF